MRNFVRPLFFLLLFCYLGVANAQDFTLKTLKESDGLPNSVFKAIAKDSLGFIWIGSDDGLIRYDGIVFEHYNQLPNNLIKDLLLTKDNRLLASTDGGILEVHSTYDSVHFQLLYPSGNEYKNNQLVYPKVLYEDSEGAIWIPCNLAIAKTVNGKLKYYHFPEKDLPQNYDHSFSIIEDGLGNLFAFSQPGNMYWYDRAADKFIAYDHIQLNSTVETSLNPEKGTILIGGTGGLRFLSFNKKGELTKKREVSGIGVVHIEQRSENQYFVGSWDNGINLFTFDSVSHNSKPIFVDAVRDINTFYYSDQGNVWIGSDKGINIFRSTFFKSNSKGINNYYVQVLERLQDGRIYTANGRIPMRAEYKNGEYVFESFTEGVNWDFIFSYALRDSTVVIATGNGEISFVTNGKRDTSMLLKCERPIERLFVDNEKNVWVFQEQCMGVTKVKPNYEIQYYSASSSLRGGFYENGKLYFLGDGDNLLYKYDSSKDEIVSVYKDSYNFSIYDFIQSSSKKVFIAANKGLFSLQNEKFQEVDIDYDFSDLRSIAEDQTGNIWASSPKGLLKISGDEVSLFQSQHGLRSSNVIRRSLEVDANNNIWAGTAIGLSFSYSNLAGKETPSPFFKDVLVDGVVRKNDDDILEGSYIELEFASLTYPSDNITYQTKIEPLQDDWQSATYSNKLQIPLSDEGAYKIWVRAKQDGNNTWSAPSIKNIQVVRHWYFTWWAILIYLIVLVVIIWFIVRFNVYRLQKQKQNLEQVVGERTKELVEKQEVLETQKAELVAKNEQISERNEKIRSSIRYAKTIQGAILPMKRRIKKKFESFVIFRPRDVVSGDFYWYSRENKDQDDEQVFLSVVDCSGHGVPGAFMSMIGYSLLNEIVKVRKLYEPKDILTELNIRVIDALRQEHTDNNDGMDLVLVKINKLSDGTYKVVFSGAKNKLYHYVKADNELKFYKGDRKSIGGFRVKRAHFEFTQQEFTVESGDMLYLITDGIIDQNQGDRERFGSKRLKELLTECAGLSLEEQAKSIEETLDTFQQEEQQRDDITILGIRFE